VCGVSPRELEVGSLGEKRRRRVSTLEMTLPSSIPPLAGEKGLGVSKQAGMRGKTAALIIVIFGEFEFGTKNHLECFWRWLRR